MITSVGSFAIRVAHPQFGDYFWIPIWALIILGSIGTELDELLLLLDDLELDELEELDDELMGLVQFWVKDESGLVPTLKGAAGLLIPLNKEDAKSFSNERRKNRELSS